MGNLLKLCLLAVLCVQVCGCTAARRQSEDTSARADNGMYAYRNSKADYAKRFRSSYEASFDKKQQQGSQQLLRKARSAIGTPYVLGGKAPGGFDCSGLVCWAYDSVGVKLPRTAREQSVVGQRISSVEDMRAGDIVAFRHPRRGYHTGIYVGDGQFIHSPRKRSSVRVNSLNDPYFKDTFLGARRVNLHGSEDLVAQAESRLTDFRAEKAARELSRDRKASSRNSAKNKQKKSSHVADKQKKKKSVHVARNKKSRSPLVADARKPEKQKKQADNTKSRQADSQKKNSRQKAQKTDTKAEKKASAPKVAAKTDSRKKPSPKNKNS